MAASPSPRGAGFVLSAQLSVSGAAHAQTTGCRALRHRWLHSLWARRGEVLQGNGEGEGLQWGFAGDEVRWGHRSLAPISALNRSLVRLVGCEAGGQRHGEGQSSAGCSRSPSPERGRSWGSCWGLILAGAGTQALLQPWLILPGSLEGDGSREAFGSELCLILSSPAMRVQWCCARLRCCPFPLWQGWELEAPGTGSWEHWEHWAHLPVTCARQGDALGSSLAGIRTRQCGAEPHRDPQGSCTSTRVLWEGL